MRELPRALLVVFICSFVSCSDLSEKNKYLLYLQEILGKTPDESQRYILVSDYSCSSCKEQIYKEIGEKSKTYIYIIVQPRNKAVLQERFEEAIFEGRLYIDSARKNTDKGIVIDTPVTIRNQGNKWVLGKYEDVFE